MKDQKSESLSFDKKTIVDLTKSQLRKVVGGDEGSTLKPTMKTQRPTHKPGN